jgi:hypothetical protein
MGVGKNIRDALHFIDHNRPFVPSKKSPGVFLCEGT